MLHDPYPDSDGGELEIDMYGVFIERTPEQHLCITEKLQWRENEDETQKTPWGTIKYFANKKETDEN